MVYDLVLVTRASMLPKIIKKPPYKNKIYNCAKKKKTYKSCIYLFLKLYMFLICK